ncbi:bifunctional folylpolyglutamate synthase/dihydrofolate synthase [Rubritepida flocculans]|uniref:bifunctional folylpolyglutamate synthase/dihydrofolate synthase n=1 Tax=Rubritepida flocculans TaxID=182403 RepID=UPI00041A8B83|nr:folylpolyglutamate synthase/dihydrofolate synthase family protein [Rubritepida flocculans]
MSTDPGARPPRAHASRAEPLIERLHALHPKLIDLSLGRMEALLAKLGHPERRLPPVLHVAGTNGKGSTCAFLRAICEAAGRRAHVYTSPHLVRFHERIRLAGELVSDDALTDALAEVERVNAGAPITVFEITTAVALLLFSRVPADVLVLEVGLGGRFDATNVIARPAATAITSISMDHMEFLGDSLAKIAFEKAGILKPGVPCATGAQRPEALAVIAARAAELGAPLLARGREWEVEGGVFRDARGAIALPPPGLPGAHQPDNAGIAIAALRAWNPPWLSEEAIRRGVAGAVWPARLQRLHGRLAPPAPWELWLDGGHNEGAGKALAATLAEWRDRPLHLIVGMKQGKTAAGFLAPLIPLATTLTAIREEGQHLGMGVQDIVAASGGAARPGPDLATALPRILAQEAPGRILVCGSLYLAGEVLKMDGTFPA